MPVSLMENSLSSSENSIHGSIVNNCNLEAIRPNEVVTNLQPYNSESNERETHHVECILAQGDTLNLKFVPITVKEAVNYFKTRDYPTILSNDQCDKRAFDIFRWLKSSPKLNENLTVELNLVQSIMQCRLDWEDPIQWRMLQTIYMNFTQSENPCPCKGTHWQRIGFQGNDPTTDLRRVGLFGVLQLLHLTSPELEPFSRLFFSVANSDVQPFPMAVLSLNATNITFNAIDSGKLIRECNLRNSVVEVLNVFYVAVLVFILKIWISQKKTIKDSGYLLKDAERYCSRNVKKVLKELPQELEKLLS